MTVRGQAIVWCDEALVHETVPASRMTPGWIVDRTFRTAINYHRSMFSFFPPLRLAPKDFAKAVAKLLLGTGQLLLLGLTGKHRRVQGLCWIAAGAGTFAAYLGIVADGYHRIQGE